MNNKEERHNITVGDGFRFGIGMFLSSLLIFGILLIIFYIVVFCNGNIFYW